MTARYDDLDTKTIALASVVSAIVLLILILAGRALAYAWESSVEERRFQSAQYEDADQWIASQKAILKDFSKVDVPGEEGQPSTVRLVIPIDNAVDLVRQELTAKPST